MALTPIDGIWNSDLKNWMYVNGRTAINQIFYMGQLGSFADEKKFKHIIHILEMIMLEQYS